MKVLDIITLKFYIAAVLNNEPIGFDKRIGRRKEGEALNPQTSKEENRYGMDYKARSV